MQQPHINQSMRQVNVKDVAEEPWTWTKGKFEGASKEISVALGRKPQSTDLNERHPFDVEICRILPGSRPWAATKFNSPNLLYPREK